MVNQEVRDRKEEVRRWFGEALNVATARRSAFLREQCTDDSVRAEVLSLLSFDGATESIPEIVGAAVEAVFDPGAPARRVGPYEIGRLLGTGGMGSVYEAERVDGHVRQRVAIKFAQMSLDEEQQAASRRRFQRERQMLASLRHPYIASLIDAGSTPDGVPYAVLEQVDGAPIDLYCDSNGLGARDRIDLFLKVCEAVQFAHRNLIVHRDIKPGNVLVTRDGIPKLIDFGVARELNGGARQTMGAAFTPGYASPEQARGLAATVATDVYGLGALLYRVLTGKMPREAGEMPFLDLVHLITEEDVAPPSSIRPEIEGDLENILLKALQREPDRRYGSVPELVEDLNRYLDQRPVQATPDSMAYRAGRFLHRHWFPVAAGVALVTSLTAMTAVAVQQRQQAQRHAAEMRRIAGRLIFEVYDEIESTPGATKAREKLGATAVEYLERLERGGGLDESLAWELLNACGRLAQSRAGAAFSIGDTGSGVQFALKALRLGEIVEPGLDPERLDKLFAIYTNLIAVFQESVRPDQHLEAVNRLLRIAPRLHPIRQAQAYKESGRYYEVPPPGQTMRSSPVHASVSRATDDFERAVIILRSLAAKPGSPADTNAQLASTLISLGRAQTLAGNFTNAVANLKEAIRIPEANLVAQPNNGRFARHMYWGQISLADAYGSGLRFNLGRLAEAGEHFQRAKAVAARLVAADPNNEMAKLDQARAAYKHGIATGNQNPAQSLALMEEALALTLETSAKNHTGLDLRLVCLIASVRPLVRLGRLDDARNRVAAAKRLEEEMRQQGIGTSRAALRRMEAMVLHAGGQREQALRLAREEMDRVPQAASPLLSENFETLELLESVRNYAAGHDPGLCLDAGGRLLKIWDELRALNPQSSIVRLQADRAKSMVAQSCQPGL